MEAQRKILVVEDNTNLSEILKDLLENNGFFVVTAQNGEEALEILKDFEPDLILADILMPGMDGFEMFSKIRSIPKLRTVPFVFLTALSDQENKFKGLGLGADDYISKPFNPQELIMRINNILKRREAMMNALHGSLSEISIVDVLQLLESRGSTGMLTLKLKEGNGEVYFDNGQIYHVALNDVVGREALKQMLRSQGGLFEFIPDVKTDVATIENISTTQLILDLMRELDEEMSGAESTMGVELQDIDSFSLQEYEPPEELLVSAVEITKDLYWVSSRESGIDSQPNTYLLRCDETFILIDPGPISYFDVILQKVGEIMENDFSKLKFMVVTNPLPDMTMNINKLLEINSEIYLLSTFENIRMMAHMNIPKDRFKPVDFSGRPIHLQLGCAEGEEFLLRFIPTPYCPLRGSLAIGIPSRNVLIPGILFSGLLSSNEQENPLFANESDLQGMEKFMKIYMPSKNNIKDCVGRIKEKFEKIEVIAPAYGKILRGELADKALELIENIDVGIDLS